METVHRGHRLYVRDGLYALVLRPDIDRTYITKSDTKHPLIADDHFNLVTVDYVCMYELTNTHHPLGYPIG